MINIHQIKSQKTARDYLRYACLTAALIIVALIFSFLLLRAMEIESKYPYYHRDVNFYPAKGLNNEI